ncbi:MAG: PDZ domain-containing protein [Bradymonadaceae bacterium]
MIRSFFFPLLMLVTLLVSTTAFAQAGPTSPPWLGVILADDAPTGAGIDDVIRQSPAARAGIAAGDRILEINGQTVNSPGKLQMIIRGRQPGQKLALKVARGDRILDISLELVPSPSMNEMLEGHHLGQLAPPFEMQVLGTDAPALPLSSLVGKPTIIEFWATWCTPCRAVARDLTAIQKRHQDKIHIVGLSSEDQSVLDGYVERNTPTYTVARDIDEGAHKGFLVRSYPVAFLLDAEHRVVGIFTGNDLGPRLEKALDRLLGEQEKEKGAQGSDSSQSAHPKNSDQ